MRRQARATIGEFLQFNDGGHAIGSGAYYKIAETTGTGNQQTSELLFKLDMSRANAACAELNNLWLHRKLKGQGWGARGVKAAFSLVSAWGTPVLRFDAVERDGYSFWPVVAGALPEKKSRVSLRHRLRGYAANPRALDGDDLERVKIIADIPAEQYLIAWRLLSQARLSAKGRVVRAEIFAEVCKDQDMFTVPSDPLTRTILEMRLGALPSFRPLSQNSHHHWVIENMQQVLPRYDRYEL